MQRLLSLLLLLSALNADSQSIWNSPAACLGQKPPSDTPQIFAQNLLTQKDTFAFDRIAFSADGREFYYPSNNSWFSPKNAKIRYFKYVGDSWQGPFVLNEHYYAPTFSMDGKTLYFEGNPIDSLHTILWQSTRTPDGGWSQPAVYLKEPYGLYMFMPTKSGVAYIGTNTVPGKRKDYSTYDICKLTINKSDTLIENLGAPINTPAFNGDFYIAPDESYMIVSANETKDFQCELYISFRRKDHSWTTPVSLTPLINNGPAHRWGEYVTPDGRYLFYSYGTSPKDCHLYWVRFDRLVEKLRRENL
jgi:WD40-like Beta Propeller Repeat